VVQILGHLVSGNKDKVKSTLTLLQSAVSKAGGDPDLWELLAELSAATGDHPGRQGGRVRSQGGFSHA
jgi:hypothetical protein